MHFKQFGKYTIIKKLAAGGMADIFLACNLNPTGASRFVIIKRALSQFSENEEFKDMFKNEGKVACNLKHRNITPIYEFGIEKEQLFLSMEYISGRNLRELVKKMIFYKHTISVANTVFIIKEVASGLNYAHNAIDTNTGKPLNLIHRDVSPQNIMLSFDGEIKLIDFGIAKIADTNLTRGGHLKGKFSYMSPEQAHGEVLDARTDIFCLGIILWELLTGKRLFASKNELTSLKKVKNCDIPDAQKINPQIPTELNNIIKKALSKNKNTRYSTAAKLEQDLSIFLNKNFPEHSQYDLISLMKNIYRKEIMEERESLKTYSLEFKKYINALNIESNISLSFENNISPNVNLNIPELGDVTPSYKIDEKTKEILGEEKTKKTNIADKETESAIEPSQTSHTTKKHLTLESDNTDKKTVSTLIKKNDLDTQTDYKKTQNITNQQTVGNLATKGEPQALSVAQTKHSPNLDIVTDESQIITNRADMLRTMSTQSSHTKGSKSSTLFDKKELLLEDLLDERQSTGGLISSLITLGFLIVLIGGGVTYFLKDTPYSVLDLLKLNTNQEVPHHSSKKQVRPTPNIPKPSIRPNRSTARAIPTLTKIFINSKPSGAAIFVNNQFSSKYTPHLLNLPANKISHITIRKEGYISKNIQFNPQTSTKNSLNIHLRVNQNRTRSSRKIHIIE